MFNLRLYKLNFMMYNIEKYNIKVVKICFTHLKWKKTNIGGAALL